MAVRPPTETEFNAEMHRSQREHDVAVMHATRMKYEIAYEKQKQERFEKSMDSQRRSQGITLLVSIGMFIISGGLFAIAFVNAVAFMVSLFL